MSTTLLDSPDEMYDSSDSDVILIDSSDMATEKTLSSTTSTNSTRTVYHDFLDTLGVKSSLPKSEETYSETSEVTVLSDDEFESMMTDDVYDEKCIYSTGYTNFVEKSDPLSTMNLIENVDSQSNNFNDNTSNEIHSDEIHLNLSGAIVPSDDNSVITRDRDVPKTETDTNNKSACQGNGSYGHVSFAESLGLAQSNNNVRCESTSDNITNAYESNCESVEQTDNVSNAYVTSDHEYLSNVSDENISDDTSHTATGSDSNSITTNTQDILTGEILNDSRPSELSVSVDGYKFADDMGIKPSLVRPVVHEDNASYLSVCPICDKALSGPERLRNHMIVLHTVDRPFLCECGKSFHLKKNLIKHIDSVHRKNEKNQVCIVCDKRYLHPSQLANHMLTHGEPTLICSFCGKAMHTKRQLTDHIDTHSAIRRHACHMCSYSCGTATRLRNHISGIHFAQKPCICDECGKGFMTKSSLRNHSFVHTGIRVESTKRKPRVCKLCGISTWGLTAHMKQHTNEKSFTCETCGKHFTLKHHLQNHLDTKHSDTRPFPCPKCDLSFKMAHHMRAHVDRKHREDALTEHEQNGDPSTSESISKVTPEQSESHETSENRTKKVAQTRRGRKRKAKPRT